MYILIIDELDNSRFLTFINCKLTPSRHNKMLEVIVFNGSMVNKYGEEYSTDPTCIKWLVKGVEITLRTYPDNSESLKKCKLYSNWWIPIAVLSSFINLTLDIGLLVSVETEFKYPNYTSHKIDLSIWIFIIKTLFYSAAV